MAFKHAKDKGLIPIFESFAPLKEGFLKNFTNSLGNGAKKLLTNADLGSDHKKIVIDSMKTYHRISGDKKPDSNEENF
ncbi:hypothetical protein HpHCM55_04100 [Helicobacter pylori]